MILLICFLVGQILCSNRDPRRAISPFRACTVAAFVVVSILFIVVFATRDTTTGQELSSKISELSSEVSRYINGRPVVKFEATRDSNETFMYVS